MKKTLGGDRIGSGKKMEVDLHTYNRSTHDLSYIWRSTMSVGTLVPFCCEVLLPGDTIDMNLDCNILTHPTLGPLFGSHKVQLDVYEAPIRLYNSWLHNNRLGIGLSMNTVLLPQYSLTAVGSTGSTPTAMNNTQINPSCLLAYLGVRGIGYNSDIGVDHTRKFNAVPFLAYWDIFKNYYANKQETNAYVVHTDNPAITPAPPSVSLDGVALAAAPAVNPKQTLPTPQASVITLDVSGGTAPTQVMLNTSIGRYSVQQLVTTSSISAGIYTGVYNIAKYGQISILNWEMMTTEDIASIPPSLTAFPLENIDKMRDEILASPGNNQFLVNLRNLLPYQLVLNYSPDIRNNALGSQEGLAVKTYNSDLFNNWLKTEWIEGPGSISAVTAIDTTSGSFSIDTLNLSKKVYDMLNRIAVSGGSYRDWLDTVYQEEKISLPESPIYHGGLIKELIFQEVVSNSAATQNTGQQPLGTLAGRGTLAKKHKGGRITIKCKEPSYLIGIVSLTPRLDYSQGNRWDTWLKTMDDFHKPALDEIGFQDLICEQMAWWDTQWLTPGGVGQWVQHSAGKQPAWINYMTNFNRTFGNFAIETQEMFMTLNRNYEWSAALPGGTGHIADLTTYIDPAKWNQIFAETRFDSQNFWCQIAVDMTARRLMSAKIMPNL